MITQDMLEQWSTQSLRDALTASPLNDFINWRHDTNFSEKQVFIKHLHSLRNSDSDFGPAVIDAPMTGNLSMGWGEIDNNEIFFQDCLAAIHASYPGSWTPADYLLQCYLTAKTKGVDLSKMDLGRALRNLPSFMREYLIAGMLSKRDGIEVEIPPEDMNAEYHVDIILKTEGIKTYIWSYLTSRKAIEKLTQKKLNGQRGKILKGQNLLAPFDNKKDAKEFHAWWVPTETYIDKLLLSLKSPTLTYEEILASIKKNPQKTFSEHILFKK